MKHACPGSPRYLLLPNMLTWRQPPARSETPEQVDKVVEVSRCLTYTSGDGPLQSQCTTSPCLLGTVQLRVMCKFMLWGKIARGTWTSNDGVGVGVLMKSASSGKLDEEKAFCAGFFAGLMGLVLYLIPFSDRAPSLRFHCGMALWVRYLVSLLIFRA